MTKSGGKRHTKRIASPKTWPIKRKGNVFVPKMSAGPHKKEAALPLVVLLRDVLKVATTRKEVKYMLTKKRVEVDGRARINERFPVGHMDIVRFVPDNTYYRIQYHKSGKVLPFEIDESEAKSKLVKITGKRNVRGGKTQISFHDGRNILLENSDKRLNDIKVNGTLKISVPEQEIQEIFHLSEDSIAMVTEGRHQGKIGRITEVIKRYGPRASQVSFLEENNDENPEFSTALEYVFVIGDSQPAVTIH